MNQIMEFTPEQITDAEKLCQHMQTVPAEKRRFYTCVLLAWMNGLEFGIANEDDEQQENTQTVTL